MFEKVAVDAFFEELKAIDRYRHIQQLRKEAGMVNVVGQAAKGSGTLRQHLAGAKTVIRKHGPTAAADVAGGVATYGVGNALFGGKQQLGKEAGMVGFLTKGLQQLGNIGKAGLKRGLTNPTRNIYGLASRQAATKGAGTWGQRWAGAKIGRAHV